jgi:hypothetical protein
LSRPEKLLKISVDTPGRGLLNTGHEIGRTRWNSAKQTTKLNRDDLRSVFLLAEFPQMQVVSLRRRPSPTSGTTWTNESQMIAGFGWGPLAADTGI